MWMKWLKALGSSRPQRMWIGLALTLVPLLAYQLLQFNRFYPITEGWFSVYGHLIRAGYRPYADLYLLLPPLYPLQIAFVQTLFGESILVLRLLGVLVTCGIGAMLFMILGRFFGHIPAAAAAVCATIYYQSGVAYIGYDFTQFLTLYLLIGAWFLMSALSAQSARNQMVAAFLAGLFLMLAILIKQSNAGLAVGVLGLASLLMMARLWREISVARLLVWLVAGGAAALLPILAMLLVQGSLANFFNQVVLIALSAKGGTSKTLTSWIWGFFGDANFQQHLLAMARQIFYLLVFTLVVGSPTILYFLYTRLFRSPRPDRAPREAAFLRWSDILTQGLAAIATVAVLLWVFNDRPVIDRYLHDRIAIIYSGLLLVAVHIYIGGYAVSLIRAYSTRHTNWTEWNLLFALGLGLTVGNGTSAGLSEISGFLALGILLAAFLRLSCFLPPAALPTLVVCLTLEQFLAERKFEEPYAWWSVTTADVRDLECADAGSLLSGMCVSKADATAIDRAVADIETYSKPDEPVMVYPHEPILYLLADRVPVGKAVVTWFDFIGRDQMREVTRQVAQTQPPVIIMTNLAETVYAAHERLFMNDVASPQRELVSLVDEMVARGRYTPVDDLTINGVSMTVYARTDRMGVDATGTN